MSKDLARPSEIDDLSLVSVDDTDPNNPVVTMRVKGTVESVKWQMGPRLQDLGTLTEGLHTFTVSDTSSLDPATYGLTLEGRGGDDELLSDLTTLDLSYLGKQTNQKSNPVWVFGLDIVRWGTYLVSAEVIAAEWGLPGAKYNRRVSEVLGTLTSTVDLPNDSGANAKIMLDDFNVDFSSGMTEIPSIGNPQFLGAVFRESTNVFGKSGESSITIDFGAGSNPGDGFAPWIMPFSTVELVVDSGSPNAGLRDAVPEPSAALLFASFLTVCSMLYQGKRQ